MLWLPRFRWYGISTDSGHLDGVEYVGRQLVMEWLGWCVELTFAKAKVG